MSTGQAASVLLVTLLLLGTFVGALLLARQRGWLSRWLGGRADLRRSLGSGTQVISSARISGSAHAHVVAVEGRRFVVFESSRQLAVHPMDALEVKGTNGDANVPQS